MGRYVGPQNVVEALRKTKSGQPLKKLQYVRSGYVPEITESQLKIIQGIQGFKDIKDVSELRKMTVTRTVVLKNVTLDKIGGGRGGAYVIVKCDKGTVHLGVSELEECLE